MDLDLHDKTCLVTGASRGIGRGIAKVLAAEGGRIAVVARRANLLEELAAEIVAAGGQRPIVVAEDLTAEGAIERIRPRNNGSRACGSTSSWCAASRISSFRRC